MLTPIEKIDGIFVKRDDLYTIAGVNGGKARTCWYLAQGARGLVTAGSRHSPQVGIVAHIAKYLGIPSSVHIPAGQMTPEIESALFNGATVTQHKAGYNNVIVARARDEAQNKGWTNIPFGMECCEAVGETLVQTNNIPQGINRIVVPVGSGMSLAGILTGLVANGIRTPFLGVVVGADPCRRLAKYAPPFWRSMGTLVKSGCEYDKHCQARIGDIDLDPIYEAKCVEYLQSGDLFWIVGRRPI